MSLALFLRIKSNIPAGVFLTPRILSHPRSQQQSSRSALDRIANLHADRTGGGPVSSLNQHPALARPVSGTGALRCGVYRYAETSDVNTMKSFAATGDSFVLGMLPLSAANSGIRRQCALNFRGD
jgi:hypothetical protein